MIDELEIEEVAKDMAGVYLETKSRGEAVKLVQEKHPSVHYLTFILMWHAIDAYEDIRDLD